MGLKVETVLTVSEKNMHRILFLIVLSLFHLAGSLFPIAFAQEEITIGAVLPLTGDAQSYGHEARIAMEHALADSKANRFKYRLVFEDDQLWSAKVIAAARKLVDIDGARVIFLN